MVGSELNASQLCALEAKATNSLLVCVNRNVAHGLRERIIPPYTALVRPPLDTMFGFGPPTEDRHGQTGGGSAEGAVGAGAFAL